MLHHYSGKCKTVLNEERGSDSVTIHACLFVIPFCDSCQFSGRSLIKRLYFRETGREPETPHGRSNVIVVILTSRIDITKAICSM